MAEENAAAKESAAPAAAPAQGKQPIILVALIVLNMIVVAGVGFMVWQGKKKDAAEPKIEHVIKGEHDAQEEDKHKEQNTVGKVIPLETFIVNLSGTKGRRVAKVNVELELEGEGAQEEIDKRKAQLRDIIIITLSSKTYEQVELKEGKDELKSELKNNLNSFMTKGKIKNVYFTEFIYN